MSPCKLLDACVKPFKKKKSEMRVVSDEESPPRPKAEDKHQNTHEHSSKLVESRRANKRAAYLVLTQSML